MSKQIEIALGVKTSGFITTHLTDEEFAACEDKLTDNITVSESNKAGKSKMLKIEVDVEEMREKFNALTVEEKDVLALKEYRTRGFGDDVRRDLLASCGLSTSTVDSDMRAIRDMKKNDPDKYAKFLKQAKELNLI